MFEKREIKLAFVERLYLHASTSGNYSANVALKSETIFIQFWQRALFVCLKLNYLLLSLYVSLKFSLSLSLSLSLSSRKSDSSEIKVVEQLFASGFEFSSRKQ